MSSETITSEAEWLKSPLSEKGQRLQPEAELLLKPYYGRQKKLRLFRTLYTVGRGEHCDIHIDDPFASPAHAELRLQPGGEGYSILDLGSRNGVFLNGVRVVQAPLPANGSLRIGRSTLSWAEAPEELPLPGAWIVGDPAMRKLLATLKKLAVSPLPVLLLGETGTGKDMLANLLHKWSDQASGPYIAVNGALTGGSLAESEAFGHRKGAFTGAEAARAGALKSAQGGTLFLDEVGDIPPPAQAKLLRALESGEVKALGADRAEEVGFRLVSATSRELDQLVRNGEFRLDLYYRIAGFVLRVPPLRERPQDITTIATRLAREKGLLLDSEAEARLLSYRWPGNVRELKLCLERAAVVAQAEGGERVLASHLIGLDPALESTGEASAAGGFSPRTLSEMERACIQASLERNGWSRSVAARELGIARSTLFEKMRRFGLRDGISRGGDGAG